MKGAVDRSGDIQRVRSRFERWLRALAGGGLGFVSGAVLGAGLGLCVGAASMATAQGEPFATELVVDGLMRPVFLTAAPDDLDRAFVIEQHTGAIRILRLADSTIDTVPFLTVTGLGNASEGGLLGLAFDPDYATNGYFYVYIANPDSHLLRYQVSADPDVADVASRFEILQVSQPQINHNGGWIGFGVDGFLYVALGDGGGGNDNETGHTPGLGNAQDLTDNLLGKLLRIDVHGDDFPDDDDRNYAIPVDNPFVGEDGDDEIWAYGLRNPHRASFDRLTHDLFVADVGQNRCEEVNVQPAASPGGENYGWRLREGTIETPTGGVGGPHPPGAIDPVFDYPHGGTGEACSDPGAGFDGISVTGGYVYRGPVAELAGRYFFGDYGTAELWSFEWDGSDPGLFDGTNYVGLTNHTGDPRFTPDIGSIDSISSFGEDNAGNLYVLDLFDGEVFRVPEPSATLMGLAALALVMGMERWRHRDRQERHRDRQERHRDRQERRRDR